MALAQHGWSPDNRARTPHAGPIHRNSILSDALGTAFDSRGGRSDIASSGSPPEHHLRASPESHGDLALASKRWGCVIKFRKGVKPIRDGSEEAMLNEA